jgi:hypothetical protein
MERDKYFGEAIKLSDPVNEAVAVVPGTPLENVSRALWVGTGGDISAKLGDDISFHTFKNVPDGTALPFRVSEVRASGTTANDMLALY